MTFQESLNSINLDLSKLVVIPSGGENWFNSKFEIDPKDFLKYAKEDLQLGSDRGAVNGLSNAKRAIDCQIDEVLCRLDIDYQSLPSCLENFIKYFDFKEDISFKLKIIQGLNLAPGLIISKARTLRNKLEHYYKIPTINEVKEAIDIADLFIRSIDGKRKSQINDFYITDKNNFIQDFEFKKGYEFYFNPKQQTLTLYEYISDKRASKIDISNTRPEFYGFIRLMNSIDDEFELTESFKIIARYINHPMPAKHINVEQF
jgi:hypothetical protein